MKKETKFKILAVLLPFLLLIFLELVFRIFNLFPQVPLFIEDEEQNLVMINSRIGERYFDKRKVPVPNLYPQTFTYEKSPKTFRIFCLGGSTTAGFPYEMTVPFPQQLKFMLQENQPDKNFEVINLGLSAINSFTVLDWLPEILGHDPDLVLIYMGHNEFYGAYGTGSNISLGNNGGFSRFMLKMQKVRIFQAMKTLVNSFAPQQPAVTDATLMEKITDSRNIPPDSELRQITYQNYADNLDIILKKLDKQNIPVIMSNLVSNLGDQPPLGKEGRLADESMTALDYYQKGITEKDSMAAYEYFVKARNRDEIPFRAPSEINSVIKNKSKEFDVGIIDMQNAFRNNSNEAIPGDKLFCDHLHPNPVGYYLMATQFLKKIYEKDMLDKKSSVDDELTPKYVTQLDWEIGGLRVFKLEQKWPFFSQETDYSGRSDPNRNPAVKIAEDFLFNHHIWGKAHSDMADHYIDVDNHQRACREFQAILAMFPEKLPYYRKLVDCAKEIKSWQIVERYSEKALIRTDVKGKFYYDLAVAQYRTGKSDIAMKNFQKALQTQQLDRQEIAFTHFYQALILAEKEQYEAAYDMLEVVILEMPGLQTAKKFLGEIEKKLLEQESK